MRGLFQSSSLAHSGVPYLDFLSFLSTELRPGSYFEVGTNTGLSLQQFTCDSVCVDPSFRISVNALRGKRAIFFFQMGADEFFADYNLRSFLRAGPDITFLDGMHRFEYLLRDFMNTEASCHHRSSIILHDCLPDSVEMVERYSANQINWAGDVWKMVRIIEKYRPEMRVFFLDCPPTGLVVCTGLDARSTVLKNNYFKIIDEYSTMQIDANGLAELRKVYLMVDTKQIILSHSDITLLFA